VVDAGDLACDDVVDAGPLPPADDLPVPARWAIGIWSPEIAVESAIGKSAEDDCTLTLGPLATSSGRPGPATRNAVPAPTAAETTTAETTTATGGIRALDRRARR
jgi:hypothetical protein